MEADQRNGGLWQIAQRQNDRLLRLVSHLVGHHAELTVGCGQVGLRHPPNESLAAATMANQIRDRDHLQVELLGEFGK